MEFEIKSKTESLMVTFLYDHASPDCIYMTNDEAKRLADGIYEKMGLGSADRKARSVAGVIEKLELELDSLRAASSRLTRENGALKAELLVSDERRHELGRILEWAQIDRTAPEEG